MLLYVLLQILHRFKLHRLLVDVTVKSVWFRQVFGLLRVRIRQVLLYIVNPYNTRIYIACISLDKFHTCKVNEKLCTKKLKGLIYKPRTTLIVAI
jgi:hypothetical protein